MVSLGNAKADDGDKAQYGFSRRGAPSVRHGLFPDERQHQRELPPRCRFSMDRDRDGDMMLGRAGGREPQMTACLARGAITDS